MGPFERAPLLAGACAIVFDVFGRSERAQQKNENYVYNERRPQFGLFGLFCYFGVERMCLRSITDYMLAANDK